GPESLPPATQGDLFSAMPAPPTPKPRDPNWHGDYRLVDTPELFAGFLTQLRQQERFALDLETTSLDPLQSAIVGWAFCWQAGVAYYLPVRGPAGSKLLDPAATLAALQPILEDAAI